MKIQIDLTQAEEAFGEETTYYGGTTPTDYINHLIEKYALTNHNPTITQPW